MTLLSVGRERLDTLAHNRVLRAIPPAVVALDLAIVAASVILAALGRAHFAMFGRSLNEISGTLALVGPLMVLGWIVAIGLGGGYSNSALGEGTDEYKRVLNAALLTGGAMSVVCYLGKLPLSRGYFLLLFALGVPALLLGRRFLRRLVHKARQSVAWPLTQEELIVSPKTTSFTRPPPRPDPRGPRNNAAPVS